MPGVEAWRQPLQLKPSPTSSLNQSNSLPYADPKLRGRLDLSRPPLDVKAGPSAQALASQRRARQSRSFSSSGRNRLRPTRASRLGRAARTLPKAAPSAVGGAATSGAAAATGAGSLGALGTAAAVGAAAAAGFAVGESVVRPALGVQYPGGGGLSDYINRKRGQNAATNTPPDQTLGNQPAAVAGAEADIEYELFIEFSTAIGSSCTGINNGTYNDYPGATRTFTVRGPVSEVGWRFDQYDRCNNSRPRTRELYYTRQGEEIVLQRWTTSDIYVESGHTIDQTQFTPLEAIPDPPEFPDRLSPASAADGVPDLFPPTNLPNIGPGKAPFSSPQGDRP
ncbi:hypothetical protein [Almyronema epifaneia]|uniref:Uncharacterized protein n=1 Tax=Almyronema epifaneia S1 TaxID=2991925 RepID=A0ABW6I9F0_9CYAN